MKKINLLISLVIVLLAQTFIFAQDGERFEDLYLKGKWKGICPVEIVNHASLSYCELCSFDLDPNNKKIASIGEIELNFNEDSLTLSRDSQSLTLPYTRNKDNHSVTFIYKDKTFHFRVFHYEDKRIIQDDDGMMVVLEEIK